MTKCIHVIQLEECKNTLETSTIFPATCEINHLLHKTSPRIQHCISPVITADLQPRFMVGTSRM